jgi:glycosyltransferase involved in cell wall biosynthesis
MRPKRPRIAVLVDLLRSAEAGGHVKWWERIAAAAAEAGGDFPFDLTVYFSGDAPDVALSSQVQLRHLKPLFSTARLKFLPYVPAHTDLSPYHPRLARELRGCDLIHTTDGFFAFARTAERVARSRGVPLTTSFHTETPAYARLFTRRTIESLCAGWPWLRTKLLEDWNAPERQGAAMERRLARHLGASSRAFVTRAEDRSVAESILGPSRVSRLRLGVDKRVFGPHRRDRAAMRTDYSLAEDRVAALFVGRVDAGKNVPVLMEAAARAIASGAPLHLVVAGLGPMREDLARRLGDRVSLPGFVAPEELARLYASVDFVALPSEVEIGGMAAVEAIASGAPTLVARGSGTAKVMDEAIAIQEVDSGIESWVAALNDLATNSERRQAMRLAALDYGAQRLATWSEVLMEDLAPGWRTALAGA